MKSQNQSPHFDGGFAPSANGHWDWLQSRLQATTPLEASQALAQWMSEQLDQLESSFSGLVTESSRKRAAGLLIQSSRR